MKYIDNRLNANIVKLEDTNNNYTSDNVEGALEEIDSKIKDIEVNGYDDTQIKQDINSIKTEIGTEELTTTDKTIKGAINEVNSKIGNVEGALEDINLQIENIESQGYDDTEIRQDINNIKNEIGSTALNTDAINIKDAINEVNTRINTVEANGYDDTQIKQDINNIETEIGTEELTTTDQTIKGAVNEIDSKIKNIENKIFLNIKDFGAIGDGLTDDTEAIQKALNKSQNIKFEKNKTYIITDNLMFNNNIYVDFNGSTIKVNRSLNNVQYPLNLKYKENVYLYNGIIDANVNEQYVYNCHAIFGMYSKNCTVDSMTVINFGLSDNKSLTEGYSGTGIGFTLDSSNIDDDCYGNVVKNCVIDSRNGSFAIRFASPWLKETEYKCYNNHAYNNIITEIGKSGIEMAGHNTTHCSAVGNTIEKTYLEGIDIDKNASDCLVKNNIIKVCVSPTNDFESYTDSYGGIGCHSVDVGVTNLQIPGKFNRIINNKILSSVGGGIYLVGSNNTIIQGNYISNCKNGINNHGFSKWPETTSNNNLIKENIIENCNKAISVDYSNDLIIDKNLILKCNDYNLYFGKSKNTIITNNKIYVNSKNDYCIYFNTGFEDIKIQDNYFSFENCDTDVKVINLVWILSGTSGNFSFLNNEINGQQKVSNILNIYNSNLNNIKIINNTLYNNDLINNVNRFTLAENSTCNNIIIKNNVGTVGILGTYKNKIEVDNISF